MTHPLTRRQLAQRALAGAAGALLAPAALAQDTEPTPMPTTPVAATSKEGAALTQAVPLSAGYALSPTQTKEVALALKDYPGPFAKARTYPIPDDVAPAWVTTPPPVGGKTGGGKGRGK